MLWFGAALLNIHHHRSHYEFFIVTEGDEDNVRPSLNLSLIKNGVCNMIITLNIPVNPSSTTKKEMEWSGIAKSKPRSKFNWDAVEWFEMECMKETPQT